MKTSLCSFCLKSGMLCQKCLAKLESGEVSDLDLKVARLLLSLEEENTSLQNVNFRCAVDAGKVLAIVVGPGDVPRILGHGGKSIKALSEGTGKKVRILEYGVDNRKFLEDLFAPLNILTINTIWLPDGTTETRVILKKRRRARLPFNIDSLKSIAQKVRGMSLRIEFAE